MKESKVRDINGLISTKSLERDGAKRLLEAELLHRSHQIRQFDRFKYGLAKDGEGDAAAFKRLSTARDELIERIRKLGEPSLTPPRSDRAQVLAASYRDLVGPRLGHAGEGPFVFGSQGCVALPNPSNGVSVVPSRSKTHGEIVTTALGPLGSVSFTAVGPSDELIGLGVDSGFGPEHVWLRNWRIVVLFPCVSTASFLTYKFTVNVLASVFSEAAGMIMTFASVGEEPSASPTSQIEVDTPAGWALIHDLEEGGPSYNGHYGHILGSLDVERTFEVGAGRTPAVAIVVGFVARLTVGRLRLTFDRDSGIGFSGPEVCYRYTPIPVVTQG